MLRADSAAYEEELDALLTTKIPNHPPDQAPTVKGPLGPIGSHWRLLVGSFFTKHMGGLMTPKIHDRGNFFFIGGHWRNPINGQFFFKLATIGSHWHRWCLHPTTHQWATILPVLATVPGARTPLPLRWVDPGLKRSLVGISQAVGRGHTSAY